MRRWFAIAAVLLMAALSAGRAAAGCELHQDLSLLHRTAKGYIHYLETGENAVMAQRLQRWISRNPAAELKPRMRAAGLESVLADTLALMRQQAQILQVHQAQGRTAALKAVNRANGHASAEKFGKRVEHLACDPDERTTMRSKLVAVAAAEAQQRRQMINVGIAWVSFIVLGGSILYFLDRLGIRRIRRTKRHTCSLPVVVNTGSSVISARFVDISRAGAKVRPDGPFTVGGKVALTFSIYHKEAHVMWHTQDYFGVRFAEEFNPLQLHKLLEDYPAEAAAASAAVKPTPGLS
ncbi:PilZ domain-containing protein [Cribrihabitans pelagius]|uniref:PilZ domain-containing protein n=1 Tax=Cribrihabitans pelagius TaxID=1765746 RepID=UPI003B5B84E7